MNQPDVRDVDNHTDAVHLVNKTASQRTHTSPQRLSLARGVLQDSGIGELVVAVVSQGGVAHAELMKLSKVGRRVANLMQALDAKGRDQFTLLERLERVGAVNLLREMFGIGCLQPRHDINLVQGELNAYEIISIWE